MDDLAGGDRPGDGEDLLAPLGSQGGDPEGERAADHEQDAAHDPGDLTAPADRSWRRRALAVRGEGALPVRRGGLGHSRHRGGSFLKTIRASC